MLQQFLMALACTAKLASANIKNIQKLSDWVHIGSTNRGVSSYRTHSLTENYTPVTILSEESQSVWRYEDKHQIHVIIIHIHTTKLSNTFSAVTHTILFLSHCVSLTHFNTRSLIQMTLNPQAYFLASFLNTKLPNIESPKKWRGKVNEIMYIYMYVHRARQTTLSVLCILRSPLLSYRKSLTNLPGEFSNT